MLLGELYGFEVKVRLEVTEKFLPGTLEDSLFDVDNGRT
jgi:hypothetical protein